MDLYLRQYNVLRVGSTGLGDSVHEGLGGQAGGFGGSQTLCHTVHIHILVEGFLYTQQMSEKRNSYRPLFTERCFGTRRTVSCHEIIVPVNL